MQPRLSGINEKEVLGYIGCVGEAPADISEMISRCAALLMETAVPRAVWRVFDAKPEFIVSGDVDELLKDSKKVIIMGATLGHEAEMLLKRTQIRDMAEAFVMDCCMSSAIENVCDNLCADLQSELAPLHLTDRFSPGYGDLLMSTQKDFFRVLELEKRIGATLLESGLMIPQKTVTAVFGAAVREQPHRAGSCAGCGNFGSCRYMREGRRCERR